MKATVYVQIDDNSLHPVGQVEGDTPDEVKSELAALLRYGNAQIDPAAAFLELAMRYDEDYERDEDSPS